MEYGRRGPKLIRSIIDPLQEFIRTQAAGGIILLAAVITALIWANSPWRDSYWRLWETPFEFSAAGFGVREHLSFWINDCLMAVFFLVVGLEIKRELLTGELATFKKAILPVFAALGGMVIPGLIYTIFNLGEAGEHGWGIPMATDIAFALGSLTLLGRKVPPALKVFLVALAIVDDMGAVVLIAIFYTSSVSLPYLGIALLCYLVLWIFNLTGVRALGYYILMGILLWYCLMLSGIHPTIAGVLLASTIPARAVLDLDEFISLTRSMLHTLTLISEKEDPHELIEQKQETLKAIQLNTGMVQTPLQRLEFVLQPWVTFLIMPLFALANAGIELKGNFIDNLFSDIGLGIVLGLVAGKTIGISIATWLAVKLRLAAMPVHTRWIQLIGVAMLGGIGFTMSIFIANLAFRGDGSLTVAKLGILAGSVLASALGSVLLSIAAGKRHKYEAT